MTGWSWLLAAVLSTQQAAEKNDTNKTMDNAYPLEPVTVVAHRSARPLSQVAGSVTVIDADEINRRNIQDIGDLVRYQPGISVPNQGSRFGLGGFRIRGIGGNRVLTEIDGVPVSDGFAIGDFSNAGRNVVDVDLLKRAEILRGPASTLYGSRAIGGVVSFVTKDPADFNYRADSNIYSAGKLGYSSDDNSWLASATGAWRGSDHQLLLHYVHRDFSELSHPLDDFENDPLDGNSDSALLKWVATEFPGGPLRLTLDATTIERSTDVQSLRGVEDFTSVFGFPYVLINEGVLGDDDQERLRASLEQEIHWDNRGLSRFLWRAYWQKTRSTQATVQRRSSLINGIRARALRDRIFSFDNRTFGAEVVIESLFESGPLSHRLVAGSDLLVTEIQQLRSGTETNLDTGAISNVVGPDTFPVRDFPISDITELGFFAQDEISLWDHRLTLIPGLRLDIYDLDPAPDDIFRGDNPGIEPVSIHANRLTPRLGLLFKLSDQWTLFAQYAQGFRAPPFNDANVGFTNFQFGYTSLPNPDLKPETSDSFEAGFRFRDQDWSFDITGFYNEYDDFIESLAFVGVNDQGLTVFQSRNIDQATIYGLEGQLNVYLDHWLPGLHWFINGNWTRGDNDTDDTPLNNVDPASIVTGFTYDHPSGRYGAELLFTANHRKQRVDHSAQEPFIPPGYGVLDITAYYAFTPRLQFNLGLFNVTDRTYWNWADVQGRPADDNQRLRLLRPGRNLSARLRFSY